MSDSLWTLVTAWQHTAAWTLVIAAPITILVLVFISAPYGRHGRGGWGPTVPGRPAWILMESPTVLGFAVIFWAGGAGSSAAWLLMLLWMLHYVHRTFIFPFRLRSTRPMPLVVASMAFAFQLINITANATWIATPGHYPDAWLLDPRAGLGAALFLLGLGINLHADTVLIHLRKPGETGYRIPRGGLYRWITCPNYFGEILIWLGWACATWSLAGLGFALYTIANLAPRAITHHRWYLDRFSDYPPERRALIPLIL